MPSYVLRRKYQVNEKMYIATVHISLLQLAWSSKIFFGFFKIYISDVHSLHSIDPKGTFCWEKRNWNSIGGTVYFHLSLWISF